jgi:hypothetical protein
VDQNKFYFSGASSDALDPLLELITFKIERYHCSFNKRIFSIFAPWLKGSDIGIASPIQTQLCNDG